MRITIDYTSALRQRAGVGRYTRNLVSALAEADRDNQFTLFCAGDAPASERFPANFEIRTTRISSRVLTTGWHRLHLAIPVERFCGASDIFHSPDFTLPPLKTARGVVTVHDLSFLKLPQCADPGLRNYLSENVPRAASRARRVLADSESTKQDVVDLLGVSENRVSVVHAGVESRFQPVRDTSRLEQVRERYRLPEFFILFVGTIEPRKNLSRLISAYGDLRRQTGLPHKLVISGAKGWMYHDIFEQVTREGLMEDVLFPGFVVDGDLPALYTLADLFLFPSLYEGFGLPPLEAMACGTPVVASDNSSLPEVLGSGALLVSAEDTTAITEAMARVLGDANLRTRLADQGRAQAARFTWERAAHQLIRAYHEALN
jgi:glycosyltransferase involved in cell wall biosynthesis